MCLATSNVKGVTQWNWEGDTIIHDPVIVAYRKVPGTSKRYDIDIRGFIASKDNAVLSKIVKSMASGMSADERALFYSHEKQSFDFRMRAITGLISQSIAYKKGPRSFDYWMFPEETLRNGGGDCEDRAFLLASLLLASGISSYSVRVALGKIYDQGTGKSYDHAWVMYKNESGVWMLIEPLLHTQKAHRHATKLAQKKARAPKETVEYIPYYVFNDTHLWKLKNNTVDTTFEEYLASRDFWEKFDPEFATGVHNSIFDEALGGLLSPTDLLYLKGVSLAQDINPAIYDPRDHFDNGYISESWAILKSRCAEYTLTGLAKACHAAADFYAHTSYEFFASKDGNGSLVIYDPDKPAGCLSQPPDYSTGGFALTRFSSNQSKCDSPDLKTKAIKCWKGKLISGRFAQPGDQAQGFLEKTFISIPYALRSAPDFDMRTCLPHHNEIAVDDQNMPAGHVLYGKQAEYGAAFESRKKAAVDHIRKLYGNWRANNC
jgi:hypothetical protein